MCHNSCLSKKCEELQCVCVCVCMRACVCVSSLRKGEFEKQQHLYPAHKTDGVIRRKRERERGEGATGSTIPVTSLCFLTSCSCMRREVVTQHALWEVYSLHCWSYIPNDGTSLSMATHDLVPPPE